jgi:hypothetical protein
MSNKIKTAIDNVGSVMGFVTENLQEYTTKMLNEIKNAKPEVETEIIPVMGYATGDNGWYDSVGGGPCNKYCRYTGLSPKIKWTCSDESNLSKLIPTPKSETGIYCYAYDKKTKPSMKNGVVLDGTFLSTEKKPQFAESAGNYNFTIYNNKNPLGLEHFDDGSNDSILNKYNLILALLIVIFLVHILISGIYKK